MASCLDVINTSRSIFESVGVKAESLAAKNRPFVLAQKTEMDVDSSDSSLDEESDEDEIEKDIPVFLLEDLETISVILKLCLRRLHLTKKDQSKNLQNIEHKIYEIQELVIKPYKALVSNISKDLDDLPLLYHYRERLKEESDNLTKEMRKVNFKITEEDNEMLNNETVCVCSMLGLRLDFLDRLEKMPSEIRDHRTLSNWIVIFLRNNYKTLSLEEKNSLNKEQLYHKIGFDPLSSAVETILARAGSMEEHIEACDWAEIFIKDEFKYNVLLCQHISTFPFQSDKTNEWFVWPGDDDHCQVNIMNLVTKKSERFFKTKLKLSDLKLQDKQHTVLFHGTDHESASDILSGRGIHLAAGRQKRDFSSGAGFYLTTKLDDALSWANSTTAKPAILVFRVDLNKARILNLNQNDGYKRWREIVNSFRLDEETAKIRNSLSAFDLIEGPLSTARRSGPSNDGDLEFDPKPFSYQMCLISDDYVDEFEQNLHSVLFCDFS